MSAIAQQLLNSGAIDRYAFELASRLARLARAHAEAVALASAAVGEAMASGHACVDLARAAHRSRELWQREAPALGAWKAQLLESGMAAAPGGYAPLIVDAKGRAYLHRFWRYEERLAIDLLARAANPPTDFDDRWLAGALDRWFGAAGRDPGIDEQRMAIAVALCQRFAVITGGPGTGKTTIAARVLALLAEAAADKPPRIALAAPTGKAAGRLEQAIREAKARLSLTQSIADAIPDRASTIHRLLGPRDRSGATQFNADAPLPIDVLLIDEVSMVDLALMANLVAATPRSARLILLGDKDQLASVEAGAVLASLTARWDGYPAAMCKRLEAITGVSGPATERERLLSNSIAVLRHSRRFEAQSMVASIARATLTGDGESAMRLLGHTQEASGPEIEVLGQMVDAGFAPYVEAVSGKGDPAAVFAALDRFRVLCVHRNGARGVIAMNRWIEARLRRSLGAERADAEWYAGRVVMIQHNDHNLRLYNGEVGVVLPDPSAHEELRVYFEDAGGGFRSFAPARLPARESGLALTVHKSQGSEFEAVALVLPEALSPIVTRELLYTAVTRARRAISVWGSTAIYAQGVSVQQIRESGLDDRLWGD